MCRLIACFPHRGPTAPAASAWLSYLGRQTARNNEPPQDHPRRALAATLAIVTGARSLTREPTSVKTENLQSCPPAAPARSRATLPSTPPHRPTAVEDRLLRPPPATTRSEEDRPTEHGRGRPGLQNLVRSRINDTAGWSAYYPTYTYSRFNHDSATHHLRLALMGWAGASKGAAARERP